MKTEAFGGEVSIPCSEVMHSYLTIKSRFYFG